MVTCDLCSKANDCTPRQIEGKEYDICSDCWTPIATRLKGKGRVKKERETVFLPPIAPETEPRKAEPPPGTPPTIIGRA